MQHVAHEVSDGRPQQLRVDWQGRQAGVHFQPPFGAGTVGGQEDLEACRQQRYQVGEDGAGFQRAQLLQQRADHVVDPVGAFPD